MVVTAITDKTAVGNVADGTLTCEIGAGLGSVVATVGNVADGTIYCEFFAGLGAVVAAVGNVADGTI